MEQQSMKSSRRSLFSSKRLGRYSPLTLNRKSALSARARVPPLPPSIEDLSPFPRFPPLCRRADAILESSTARDPLLFFGIRGVECIRSSVSWPEYGGECEECHNHEQLG